MNDQTAETSSNVAPLPTPAKTTIISDELRVLMEALQSASPRDAKITFDYDGKLHVHIDVRDLEDVARLEVVLPTLCGKIFSNFRRGSVDNHPFLHRLTASVER